MADTSAARLAATLRAAAKDQALSGSDLADRIERLTGKRPSAAWISRRLGATHDSDESGTGRLRYPLIRISPDLFTLATVLGLDPMDLIEDAVRNAKPAGVAGT